MKTIVVGSIGPKVRQPGSLWPWVSHPSPSVSPFPQLWNADNEHAQHPVKGLPWCLQCLAWCLALGKPPTFFCCRCQDNAKTPVWEGTEQGTEPQDVFLPHFCLSNSVTVLKRTLETTSSHPHFTDKGWEAHHGSLWPTELTRRIWLSAWPLSSLPLCYLPQHFEPDLMGQGFTLPLGWMEKSLRKNSTLIRDY